MEACHGSLHLTAHSDTIFFNTGMWIFTWGDGQTEASGEAQNNRISSSLLRAHSSLGFDDGDGSVGGLCSAAVAV